MDFIRKVKSQEEKDQLIAEKKREWDAIPVWASHLVAHSEEDHLARFAESLVVEKTPYVAPREANAEETAALDGRLLMMRLYGSRADSNATGVAALDDLSKANEDAELRKLLGPGRRAKTEIEVMVDNAIEEILSKGRQVPPRESEREGILTAMAASFFQAHFARDKETQRKIVRELVAA